MYLALLPFCLQPPVSPQHRFLTLPLSSLDFLLAEVWASPQARRLAAHTGRIEFVILQTGSSLPVAPHLVSRRRNNSSLQAGERLPEEDFHLSNQVHFQAHEPPHSCGGARLLSRAAHAGLFCSGFSRGVWGLLSAILSGLNSEPTVVSRPLSPDTYRATTFPSLCQQNVKRWFLRASADRRVVPAYNPSARSCSTQPSTRSCGRVRQSPRMAGDPSHSLAFAGWR